MQSLMQSTGSDDDQATNRRPSELNAATDLVGLSGVPPPPVTMSKKVDEPDLDGDNAINISIMNGAADDLLKKPKGNNGENPAERQQQAAPIQPKVEPAPAAPQDAVANTVPAIPPPVGAGTTGDIDAMIKLSSSGGGPSAMNDGGGGGTATATSATGQPLTEEGPDGEKTAFPILLHEIVTDTKTDDCIHWLSCGTRFMISDKKKFAKDVLPRFYGHAKFTSFTRRLKRWSFTRVPSGPFMGAYYNANFRRGEPELATRVRYDHPTPLSGAAMQLNKAKLQAVGSVAAAMGGGGMMPGGFVNPMMAGMPLSDNDREMLLRQMNMMNGGAMNQMGMMPGAVPPQAGGNPNLESLYRAMNQNAGQPNNLAATNNSVALQMAMAQEMMQQRQAQMGNFTMDQARLLAHQQQMQQAQHGNPNQMSLLNAAQFNGVGAAANQPQGQQGQGPEDQRLLAAMFLERLNKQNQQGQQGQGQPPNAANLQQAAHQQQQQHQQNQQGNTFAGSSMPSLASITPASSLMSSHPSGLSGLNFGGQAQNRSDGSLSGGKPAVKSSPSMTTLNGQRPAPGTGAPAGAGIQQLQLNFPNGNAGGQAQASAVAAAGGGGANPTAMNALLADYLRRTSGAPGGAGNGGAQGGDNGGGESKTEASC